MNVIANAKKNLLPLFSAYLFCSYPIIFLWSKNWEDVFIQEITITLSVVLIVTTIFYCCYLTATKNSFKASISCCIINFFFFSFGSIFNHTTPTFIWLKSTIKIWNYNVLIPAWVLICLFFLYVLKKTSNKTSSFLFNIQNILSVTLIAFATPPILSHLTHSTVFPRKNVTLKNQIDPKRRPNIYYIILDEYGRQDVLKVLYQYDNNTFINFLKKHGFFVAEKSCSNYSTTALSIPSSLSMNFLDIPEEDRSKHYFSNWSYSPSSTVENSPLIKILKEYGYLFINIASGFGFTLKMKTADREMVNYYLSSFTDFLVDQSLFGPFSRKFSSLRISGAGSKIILNQLSCLSKTPSMTSPHFVFCHILCPHFPFVFNEDGEEISDYEQFFDTRANYSAPYLQQISAINKKIMIAIEDLLQQDPNSIIILQADHGPCYGNNFRYYCLEEGSFHKNLLVERMGILNAYHFPKTNAPEIPNDVTPVNSFRIILNHYFGASLPLLPNICHWSTIPHIFNFTEYPAEKINTIEIKGEEILDPFH